MGRAKSTMGWANSSVSVLPQPSSYETTPQGEAVVSSSSAQSLDEVAQWTHYSTTKFLALNEYTSRVSRWRVAFVLLATPLPALVASVLPSFIPLENPLLGMYANRSMLAHTGISIFLVAFGTILLTLGAAATPRSQYSERSAAGVALIIAAGYVPITYLIGSKWRFPIPFVLLTMTPIYGILVMTAHIILLRNTFRRFPHLILSLKRYEKPSTLQLAQLVVYTGFTVAFERVSTVYQVGMVIAFPIVKALLKKLLQKFTTVFGEMSTEITVSTVEICASLYQSMIMQTSSSTLALVAIMGVDLIQGIISIKFFMGRHMKTPHREVFPRAVELLRRYQAQGVDVLNLSALVAQLPSNEFLVVKDALQLASAADKILLVEYFEVSVPVANALFLVITYHSTSTLYNTRLNRFYGNTELVMDSTQSVLLYSLLQGVSLLMFHIVLRVRHNMSALHHLAFVLEYHWRSIHGKLLVFFTLIFYFTVVHNGADFSLRFDYAKLMAPMTIPQF